VKAQWVKRMKWVRRMKWIKEKSIGFFIKESWSYIGKKNVEFVYNVIKLTL